MVEEGVGWGGGRRNEAVGSVGVKVLGGWG